MIKDILCKSVESQIPEQEVAVLLSGGVDSLSVAFAASDVGKTVHAYSFHLDTHETYDYQMAKKASEIMGWNFTGISVPTNDLENDWFQLRDLGAKKKTHYECMWPFLYVYPKIQEKNVLTGWGADGFHCLSRKGMQHWRYPKEKFDQFRDDYFLPEKTAGLKWHLTVVEKYDKVMVNPYLDKKVKDYFYQFTWDELNKPKQKQHIRDAFPELKKFGNIKPHLNLQLASGVDKVFETLLNNKKINFRNRKRVMDMCRDWNVLNNTNTLEEFFI